MNTLTTTWTLGSGRLITATASLITTQSVYNDGDRMEVACTPHISVNIEVAGVGPQFGGVRTMTAQERAKYPAHSHVCGKLALTTEQANQVAAIVAQLEAQPVWQQHLARGAKKRAERADYDAHTARMAKIMGE